MGSAVSPSASSSESVPSSTTSWSMVSFSFSSSSSSAFSFEGLSGSQFALSSFSGLASPFATHSSHSFVSIPRRCQRRCQRRCRRRRSPWRQCRRPPWRRVGGRIGAFAVGRSEQQLEQSSWRPLAFSESFWCEPLLLFYYSTIQLEPAGVKPPNSPLEARTARARGAAHVQILALHDPERSLNLRMGGPAGRALARSQRI